MRRSRIRHPLRSLFGQKDRLLELVLLCKSMRVREESCDTFLCAFDFRTRGFLSGEDILWDCKSSTTFAAELVSNGITIIAVYAKHSWLSELPTR
jgi:hypothetical protein